MGDLQSACPLELSLVFYKFVKYATEMERLVHSHFKERRLTLAGKRTEWFNLTEEEVAGIKKIIPREQWLPNQELGQDHRKGASTLTLQNNLYRPASSYYQGSSFKPLMVGLNIRPRNQFH
jgi:hypothetical protein